MPTRKEAEALLLANRQRIAQLEMESKRFEKHYQDIVAKFYQAQADYAASAQQCADLRQVVQAKQHLLHVLLPFYPTPLTPEQQYTLGLTDKLAA